MDQDVLPEVVLFDLDGTLLDNSEIVVDTYYTGMEHLGYEPCTREFIAQQAGKSTFETAQALGLAEKDIHKMDVWFWKYFSNYCKTTQDEVIPVSSTTKVLQLLHTQNIEMAVVTSNSSENARILLQKAGIAHFFGAMVGKEDVKQTKPASEPIETALKRLNKNTTNVWMVGDSASDIYAAKHAGITSVALPLPHTIEPVIRAEPDYIADSMDDLHQILEGLITDKQIN